MKKVYLVHEVAEETGLHPDTIRKLADKGVIKCKRNWNNYRVFSKDAFKILQSIMNGTIKLTELK